MSDITPKSIAPPSGIMPALPTAAPAASNTATAAEIPAAVANLSVGTFVTGTVVERNPRGLVVLRTDKGTIKIQTPVPLKPGSTVTLQIQSVGAQVQLSILSVDGQPLANASVRPAPTQTRLETAIKTSATDGSPIRAQSVQANTSSHPPIEDGHDGTSVRHVSGDRLVSDRGAPIRPTAGQTPAPAGSFVARPLAQINSAGLEALSSPPATIPGATSNTPRATVVANAMPSTLGASGVQTPSTASPNAPPSVLASGIINPGATPDAMSRGTTSPGTTATSPSVTITGVTSAGAPSLAATSSGATSPGATIASVTTTNSAAPAIIAPGNSFAASFVAGSPTTPSLIAEHVDLPAPGTNSGSLPLAAPLPAAPKLAAAPPVSPPALPSDRVILRLLGMEPPTMNSGTTGPAMTTPPASPHVSPGLTVASDAITTIGTITDGGDLPHVPPSSVAAASGKTLIATPFGVLSAAGPAPGPVGTRLLLEVILRSDLAEAQQPLATSSGLAMTSSLAASGKTWPVLRDIMAAVQVIAPEAAEHLANVTLPRIGPNLAAGMMSFVAALRQGNPRAWLGEQTDESLQRTGHGGLIDKLADDFTVVTRLAAETGPHGWQTLLLPLYDGDQLQQIRMYWKRQKRKSNQKKDGTRFVVEADLTKLGTLQLDGVFNKPQFDLVVRTSTSLPAPIRGDIIEIFGDALLATSLKGAVSFQTNAQLRAGPPASDAESGIGFIV